jgi:hypothetical protein
MNIVDGIIEGVAGINEAQLNELRSALPVTAQLIALSQKFIPIIQKGSPLFDELLPLYQEAKPMIAQALVEWKELAPALTIALGVIAKKTKQGATLSAAVASMADEYRS